MYQGFESLSLRQSFDFPAITKVTSTFTIRFTFLSRKVSFDPVLAGKGPNVANRTPTLYIHYKRADGNWAYAKPS